MFTSPLQCTVPPPLRATSLRRAHRPSPIATLCTMIGEEPMDRSGGVNGDPRRWTVVINISCTPRTLKNDPWATLNLILLIVRFLEAPALLRPDVHPCRTCGTPLHLFIIVEKFEILSILNQLVSFGSSGTYLLIVTNCVQLIEIIVTRSTINFLANCYDQKSRSLSTTRIFHNAPTVS